MTNKRFQTAQKVQAVKESVTIQYQNEDGSSSGSRYGGEGEPMFVLQRRTGAYSAVSALIQQVWEELPHKDWFAIDEPGYLSHILSLQSTLVFEACTPEGKLAAVCVLVQPETEEENLGQYTDLPRGEWHQVMHVDMAATLPAYRGHSLQGRLMDDAENFLRQKKDTQYLMATVHPDNLPSRRSMEKLGYTCVAQTTLYGGLPRCVYCKRISAPHQGVDDGSIDDSAESVPCVAR